MKYYIIAGEASGDLHGSKLINAILKNDPAAKIRAWGGEKMEEAGAEIIKHYRDLAFMVTFGIQLLMYTTTVIYPLSSAPEKYKTLYIPTNSTRTYLT